MRVTVLVALAAAAVFVVRWATDPRHRPLLETIPRTANWALVLLASVVWIVTFGTLVVMWGRSMRWWGTPMPDAVALRTFFLANVGRYIPGAVWQFAGVAAMASEVGVSPIAATTGLLIQQLVLLVTGALWTIALAPSALTHGQGGAHETLLALGLLAGLGLAVAIVPRVLPPLERLAQRRLRRPIQLPAPSHAQFAIFTGVHALGWIGYGASFWLLARGLLGDAAPGVAVALGAYISSYVLGILAVFAPGGLGVREGALVVTLTPVLGLDRALLLSVASRLWLVLLELLGALVLAPRRRSEPSRPA